LIIGLSGSAGSGKDTVARGLPSFKSVAFATVLKEVAMKVWNLSPQQVFGKDKDKTDRRWGITPRVMLQSLGEHVRNIHRETWIRHVMESIEQHPEDHYVITDVRYRNEVEAILDHGGLVFWISRKSNGLGSVGIPGHPSEPKLTDLSKGDIILIGNNGTPEEASNKIMKVVSSYI
jgi:hypothetical protein